MSTKAPTAAEIDVEVSALEARRAGLDRDRQEVVRHAAELKATLARSLAAGTPSGATGSLRSDLRELQEESEGLASAIVLLEGEAAELLAARRPAALADARREFDEAEAAGLEAMSRARAAFDEMLLTDFPRVLAAYDGAVAANRGVDAAVYALRMLDRDEAPATLRRDHEGRDVPSGLAFVDGLRMYFARIQPATTADQVEQDDDEQR